MICIPAVARRLSRFSSSAPPHHAPKTSDCVSSVSEAERAAARPFSAGIPAAVLPPGLWLLRDEQVERSDAVVDQWGAAGARATESGHRVRREAAAGQASDAQGVLQCVTSLNQSDHSANGRDKVVSVKRHDFTQIGQKVDLLLDSSGSKIHKLAHRHVESTNESVRGIWSQLHADMPAGLGGLPRTTGKR